MIKNSPVTPKSTRSPALREKTRFPEVSEENNTVRGYPLKVRDFGERRSDTLNEDTLFRIRMPSKQVNRSLITLGSLLIPVSKIKIN